MQTIIRKLIQNRDKLETVLKSMQEKSSTIVAKITQQIIPNPSKVDAIPIQNLSKIDEIVSLDRFGSPVAPRSAPGTLQDDGVSENVHFFCR